MTKEKVELRPGEFDRIHQLYQEVQRTQEEAQRAAQHLTDVVEIRTGARIAQIDLDVRERCLVIKRDAETDGEDTN